MKDDPGTLGNRTKRIIGHVHRKSGLLGHECFESPQQRPATGEDILVNNEVHGGGGLTITDNGGGSYTAEYTWDPPIDQIIGLYDLYCQVTDGLILVFEGFQRLSMQDFECRDDIVMR